MSTYRRSAQPFSGGPLRRTLSMSIATTDAVNEHSSQAHQIHPDHGHPGPIMTCGHKYNSSMMIDADKTIPAASR